MPSGFRFKIITTVIMILIVVNLSYISVHLLNGNSKTILSGTYSDNEEHPNSNRIGKHIWIDFNIMDIYRIDVTCDYIVQALGSRVSTQYANKADKRCSRSSLSYDSRLKTSKSSLNNSYYQPLTDASHLKDFDPFKTEDDVNLRDEFKRLKLGGEWTPGEDQLNAPCNPSNIDNVVFIVPFTRSRLENLKLFLVNMHMFLQNVPNPFKYRLVIAEQSNIENNGHNFNKGQIYNAAFNYVRETYENVDCVVLHDVDLVPVVNATYAVSEEAVDYRCRIMPWHLTRKVLLLESNSERVYNQFLTGGILSMRIEHFIDVNGFSNKYFGWGAEDDDFQLRMMNSKLCIMRPESRTDLNAPFMMLKHARSNALNSGRYSMLTAALNRQFEDGLNDIHKFARVEKVTHFRSFTHLSIKTSRS